MKYPNIAAFVGYDGDPVWVEPENARADDDPLVVGWPGLFSDEPAPRGLQLSPDADESLEEASGVSEPVKRGPGRPRKDSTDRPPALD